MRSILGKCAFAVFDAILNFLRAVDFISRAAGKGMSVQETGFKPNLSNPSGNLKKSGAELS
jgi:hypothetical protein